jgi:hypothetical protein
VFSRSEKQPDQTAFGSDIAPAFRQTYKLPDFISFVPLRNIMTLSQSALVIFNQVRRVLKIYKLHQSRTVWPIMELNGLAEENSDFILVWIP